MIGVEIIMQRQEIMAIQSNKNSYKRIMIIATCITKLGDGAQFIASAWLLVGVFRRPDLLPALVAAEFLVSVAVAILTSKYSQKINSLYSAICCDLSLFGLTTLLFTLVMSDNLQIWYLFILAPLILSLRILWNVSTKTLTGLLVPHSELQSFNFNINFWKQVGITVGYVIGGVVVANWGVSISILINAISFLVSTVFLSYFSFNHGKIYKPLEQIGAIQVLPSNHKRFSGKNIIYLHSAAYIVYMLMVPIAETIYPQLSIKMNVGPMGLSFLMLAFTIGTLIGSYLRIIKIPIQYGVSLGLITCSISLYNLLNHDDFRIMLVASSLLGVGWSMNALSVTYLQQTVSSRLSMKIFSWIEIASSMVALVIFFIAANTSYGLNYYLFVFTISSSIIIVAMLTMRGDSLQNHKQKLYNTNEKYHE